MANRQATFAIGENLHINEQENNNGKEEKDGGDDGRKEGKEVIIKESIIVDGEIIPPKPEFPDNCCMSGCAHCVIDIYNEDLEEWEKKINQVKERLKKKGKTLPSNIFQKNGEDDDDNSNVNVGLKVFMELENLSEFGLINPCQSIPMNLIASPSVQDDCHYY
ncbi:2403_t:CDS:2 [Entrophospora sp. SA101]|nr:2403_t:CDS:2 [Entrophospora sp. SA101]